MGVADRDYFRQPSCGGGFFDWSPGTALVCKRLIAANVVVFLLQIFLTRPMTLEDVKSRLGDRGAEYYETLESQSELSGWPRVSFIEDWCQLDTTKVLHGQVWRLLTSAFCHERFGVWHILFNMLFLWWFGKTLETMYGSREFLLFYLTAAVVAGLAFVGLQLFTGDRIPCIGASGAVMAVVMLYAIHFPRERIYVFMLIPIEIRWLVALYVIVDLHPVLLALAGDKTYSGVAHAAHLGGLAFGFLYWRRNLRLEPVWENLRRRRWPRWFGPRRAIRLYKPPARTDDELDGLVDAILSKVHEEGEASLTDVEREVLQIAGERYRRQR
jgi:membrane associated rhomboid family serine protease